MPNYTHENLDFRVDTTLGKDVLLLESFSGEEGVSTPFEFVLKCLSEEAAAERGDVDNRPGQRRASLRSRTRAARRATRPG
jgi:uncharacterized protein involved in type VI secretion and phage assembly